MKKQSTGGVKKTDPFHIQVGRDTFCGGIRQFPCEQLTGRGYYCASSMQISKAL